jgi:hypothetical protein
MTCRPCLIAKPLWVALACSGEFDNYLGDYFGGEIVLI